MIYLEMKDLVGNAFIELLRLRSKMGINLNTSIHISYEDLDRYGSQVSDFYSRTYGNNIVFILSRDKTYDFLWMYSEYFKESTSESDIELMPGIMDINLVEKFRVYLPYRVINSFGSEQAHKVLLEYLEKLNKENDNA